MAGWIKLHRAIEDNDIYFNEKFSRGQAWIDLLLLATHTPRYIVIRGVDIELQPGELCWSQRNIAVRWGWNYKTVVKFLKQLQKRGMVVTRTNNVTTVITIVNWSKYQDYGEQNGEQKGERAVNKTVTNNNVKNVKKEEYPPFLFEIFQNQEKKESDNGSDKNKIKRSFNTRNTYRPDPEKIRARYEELKKLFPGN